MMRSLSILMALCMLTCCGRVDAGLTGENVALIVNGASTDSLTVANHYISLRNIPLQNVIVLDQVPTGLAVSLDDFRDQILRPVFETINSRGLAAQIHVIVYSAGFPTSVKIAAHTKRLTDPNQRKYQTPTASINSLTYFYRWVLSDSPDYLGWGSNFYARGPFARHFANPFGGEKRERFQAAVDAAEAEDFQAAAETFASLASEFPTLHPLRILAAENWLRGGEQDKALQQVGKAIQHGWINRRYLTDSDPLATLFAAADSALPESRQRLLEPLQDVPMQMQGPLGFSSSTGWTMSGHRVAADEGAMPYMLSCVLAVIHENGSTLDEAIAVLERAAQADRTYPAAKFGFSKTSDVRSTTRFPAVPDALAWLLCRDQSVEVFPSALPSEAHQYIGMMLGAAGLAVQGRQWTFAPGAIAENLTSLGAVFSTTSQTKLTELLHAGAAISCGAVAEPYAIAFKFPAPMLYPYYYEGVTAIEAFYLALQSPYQMLIVGDPLCQPYAQAPNDFVRIQLAESSAQEASPVIAIHWQLLPDAEMGSATRAIELYLNGKLASKTRPVENINVKLPSSASGVVDVRVILVGDHPTEPRIGFHDELIVGDELKLPRLTQQGTDKPELLTLSIDCPGADRLEIMHAGRLVHAADELSAPIEFKPAQIGRGPVRLQVIAHHGDRIVAGRVVEFAW